MDAHRNSETPAAFLARLHAVTEPLVRHATPGRGITSLPRCISFYLLLLIGVVVAACGGAAPSGRIVYVTCTSASECAFVSINPDGSGRETLFTVDVPEGEVPLLPQCSPDGKEIVYFLVGEEKSSIFRAGLDGNDITDLTPTLHAVDPAWSPDGSEIVFSGGPVAPPDLRFFPQLWVMNADGSEARPLTDNERINLVPSWSPDGQKIAFYSAEPGSTTDFADIWVIDADGSEPRPLITGPSHDRHPLITGPSHDRQPAWAPDGQTVAFTRVGGSRGIAGDPGLGGQIFLADASGQNVRPVTSDPLRKFLPRWSPDGDRITFSTAPEFGERLGERDQRFQTYVINADGSHQEQITNEPNGAHFATWCP